MIATVASVVANLFAGWFPPAEAAMQLEPDKTDKVGAAKRKRRATTVTPSGKEIYVSVDLESDGPRVGENSMLSLGAGAFNANGDLLDTFYANLFALPGAKRDRDTMKWWKTQPEAWQLTREDRQPPEVAMTDYWKWFTGLDGKRVLVAYPVAYDIPWLNWYVDKFVHPEPGTYKPHAAIDTRSFAMAVLGSTYGKANKGAFPASWFEGTPAHNHHALTDAIEQGKVFTNMLNYNKRARRNAAKSPR